MEKSPFVRNKQRVEKDALQKMFLLTEPAFKSIKEHFDSEQFLSNLDKDLKKVLYKNLPSYKKWLIYKDLIIKYAALKKFLSESKAYKDDESTRKLHKLEKRILNLEALKTEQEQNVISNGLKPKDKEKSSVQNEPFEQPNILNSTALHDEITNHDEEFFETSPNESNQYENGSQNELEHVENVSPEKEQKRIEHMDEDTGQILEYGPPKVVFHNEEERLQKQVEDDWISEKTPYTRIHELPRKVRENQFSHLPKITWSINNLVEREIGGELFRDVESVTINPMMAVIAKDGSVKVQMKDGWFNFPTVLQDDYRRLRDYLVEIHRKINDATEEYDKENPAKKIQGARYKFRDHTEGKKMLSYKDLIVTVPDEIVDDVKEWIEIAKLTPKKLKKKIDERKRKLILDANRSSVHFNDPMNRSSLMTGQSLLAERNTALNKPVVHSTPQRSSSARASLFNTTKQNRSLNETFARPLEESMEIDIPFDMRSPGKKRKMHQLTLDGSMRIVKHPHREVQREGEGAQRRWEKI